MDEVGDADKAACRKEVLVVREEEEDIKETVTFQFCLGSCWYSFVALLMLLLTLMLCQPHKFVNFSLCIFQSIIIPAVSSHDNGISSQEE